MGDESSRRLHSKWKFWKSERIEPRVSYSPEETGRILCTYNLDEYIKRGDLTKDENGNFDKPTVDKLAEKILVIRSPWEILDVGVPKRRI